MLVEKTIKGLLNGVLFELHGNKLNFVAETLIAVFYSIPIDDHEEPLQFLIPKTLQEIQRWYQMMKLKLKFPITKTI